MVTEKMPFNGFFCIKKINIYLKYLTKTLCHEKDERFQ